MKYNLWIGGQLTDDPFGLVDVHFQLTDGKFCARCKLIPCSWLKVLWGVLG